VVRADAGSSALSARTPRLLLIALLAGGCTSTAPAPAEAGLPVPAGAQEATVVRLVDGDTVILRGRGAGPLEAEPTRVRVLLVDTPEVHNEQECFGGEASERAAELLPDGAQVRVQADRDPEDRFGRALLHVWADGVNVGEALVREGFAEVLQLDPNELYLEAFDAAEEDAREAGRGLWTACR
jgi:micrococcal nuclease